MSSNLHYPPVSLGFQVAQRNIQWKTYAMQQHVCVIVITATCKDNKWRQFCAPKSIQLNYVGTLAARQATHLWLPRVFNSDLFRDGQCHDCHVISQCQCKAPFVWRPYNISPSASTSSTHKSHWLEHVWRQRVHWTNNQILLTIEEESKPAIITPRNNHLRGPEQKRARCARLGSYKLM